MKKAAWYVAILAALVTAGIVSKGWFCGQYPDHSICATPSPSPSPSPTATPTASPTPEPTPSATPTPTPTPVPTPTPTPTSACPRPLAPGAKVYVVDQYYGQGEDSTVRVYGDPVFCASSGGAGNDCHLGGLGARRFACEYELIGNACAEWQYSDKPNGPGLGPCHDDKHVLMSCDHFGRAGGELDDPKTKTTGDTVETLRGYEGRPLVCGLQRDEFGPKAAPFTIAHGKAYVRACPAGAPLTEPSSGGPGRPTGRCGQWLAVDH